MRNREEQHRRARERKVKLKGHYLWVYQTIVLARRLHRTSECIRRWRSKKFSVIPEPILRTEDGKCLYLAEEIEIYCRMVELYGVQAGTKIPAQFTAQLTAEVKLLKSRILAAIQNGEDPGQVSGRLPEYRDIQNQHAETSHQ